MARLHGKSMDEKPANLRLNMQIETVAIIQKKFLLISINRRRFPLHYFLFDCIIYSSLLYSELFLWSITLIFILPLHLIGREKTCWNKNRKIMIKMSSNEGGGGDWRECHIETAKRASITTWTRGRGRGESVERNSTWLLVVLDGRGSGDRLVKFYVILHVRS